MPRTFTITTPAETVPVAKDGHAEIVFTVANTSGVPNRGMARIVSLENTRSEWMRIDGDTDRAFPTNGTSPFNVVAELPAGTKAGRYPFRLDVVSAQKSGQDYSEGPIIALAAAGTPIVIKKVRWPWIVAIIAALAVTALAARLLLRPRSSAPVAAAAKTAAVVPERQRAEKVATAWFTATRNHDAAALVALTDVPFYVYFGDENFILASKSDVEQFFREIVAASDGSARVLTVRHIHPQTIGEWKAQGAADPARHRVVSTMSMADTDWIVELGVGQGGQSQTNRLTLFVRFVGGEPKIMGTR